MSFAAEHADALATLIAEGGQAITFTLTSPGNQSDTLGTYTGPVTTTVSGYAMSFTGDPKAYAALGLVESEAPSLFFVANTYGDRAPLASSCTFGGVSFVVRAETPFMPDGTAIFATIIVVRP